VYHSTLGWGLIKKKKVWGGAGLRSLQNLEGAAAFRTKDGIRPHTRCPTTIGWDTNPFVFKFNPPTKAVSQLVRNPEKMLLVLQE